MIGLCICFAVFLAFVLVLLAGANRQRGETEPPRRYLVRSENRGDLGRFEHEHEALAFADAMACHERGVRIWVTGPSIRVLVER